jgi:hypothetical protein
MLADDARKYCWVFVMRDGKAVEITEYTDTQLINDVLTPPGAFLDIQGQQAVAERCTRHSSSRLWAGGGEVADVAHPQRQ